MCPLLDMDSTNALQIPNISKQFFFFSNDISGSRGEFCRLCAVSTIQIHYWNLCAFLSQLTTRTTNLDLHFNCQVNERNDRARAKDRRLRFQLPSFRFASYRNPMCACVNCRLVQTEKNTVASATRTHIHTVFSFLFTQTGFVECVFSLVFALVSLFSCLFTVLIFSLRSLHWCWFTL